MTFTSISMVQTENTARFKFIILGLIALSLTVIRADAEDLTVSIPDPAISLANKFRFASEVLNLGGGQRRELPPLPFANPIGKVPAASCGVLGNQDWASLSLWFHQPQFNITDGLDCYNEDYRTLLAKPNSQRIAYSADAKK